MLRRRFGRTRAEEAWLRMWHAWLPPVHQREFWAVQALVMMIAILHSLVEYEHMLDEHSPIYLVPTTLYLIPIVYAAVNFGLRGAVLTALWSAVLVLPNVLFWHEGLGRLGEVVQLTWITVAAIFVGSRVDRERNARLDAERRESAQRVSEQRYRSIMDNVDEPIILLDDDGLIVEANQSAASLLGGNVATLRGGRLPGPVGARIRERLDPMALGETRIRPMLLGQPERWFELVPMATTDRDGTGVLQLLLRDVTASYEREQGLESLTRQALATREEEQQRIARELHDGPLQSLIQLWRTLDALANRLPDEERVPVLAARLAAEDVADELRRFSRDLRPSILDDLGISAAIRAEAEALEQRTDVKVSLRVEGEAKRLDGDVELALLRITQEAMRNIERHASASRVNITLSLGHNQVRLTIVDNGQGLDRIPTVSELLSESHLGLIGMEERARLVGGQLSVNAPADGGLAIEATVRLDHLESGPTQRAGTVPSGVRLGA